MGVEWVSVLSSAIEAVGFDAEGRELYVRFRASSTYVYYDVPAEVYRELLEAGSKGGYVSNVIRPSYRGRPL